MPYSFPPDLRQLVEQSMHLGGFQSEDDLLRDALAAWKTRNDDLAAIREGIAEMEAGKGQPFEQYVQEFYQQRGLAQP